MESISNYVNQLIELAVSYAPKVLLALILLLIGFWVISKIVRLITRGLDHSNLAIELKKFMTSLVSILLKILLIFSVAGILGVETTSFIAIMGAATLAVGMALQGSLGNFASGVMVMFFRPYRIGDVVEISDTVGEVVDIQIFNTILLTPDNKTIIIPNSIATSNKISNYSTKGSIRVDTYINIGYDEDLEKVRGIVMDVIAKNSDVLQNMPNNVAIQSYEDHALKVGVFAFTVADKYWKVFYELRNEIKKALGSASIQAAYPIGIAHGDINAN